jgi:hypothetical protein
VYPNLPYFLQDFMPSGFLGELIPRTHRQLGLPTNIQLWDLEQCFVFWSFFGWNLVGNLILGQRALNLYLEKKNAPSPPIPQPELNWHFPILAEQVQQEGDEGSFAMGEHPKFLIDYRQTKRSSLVKFSPPIGDPLSQRVADLLVAEHIASLVLSKAEIKSARSKIIRVKNQIFLEIDRFDRTETQGRRGIISLKALASEYGGSLDKWTSISALLLKSGKIEQQTHLLIFELELFGELIGNSEMDPTNLSFYFERLQLGALAPVYDMGPKRYFPKDDQLIQQEYTVRQPIPEQTIVWNKAFVNALEFWAQTSTHPEISKGFQDIARENHLTLSNLKT